MIGDWRLSGFLLLLGLAAVAGCLLRGWLVKRRVDRQCVDRRDDDPSAWGV